MGRGDRSIRRWKNDRIRKKRARGKAEAQAKGAARKDLASK